MKSSSCPTQEELKEYYEALPRENGFTSQCRMELIGDIRGKRVLDEDCRRGKGVIKLSARVGEKGFALGIDPNKEWIERGLSYMDESWRRNGLTHNNMDYRVAYPENLAAAGIEDGSFDLIFMNTSVYLAYDPDCAFAEAFRALRPGGTLILNAVVASSERDADVVKQARAIGNAIQASPCRKCLSESLMNAGFDDPEYYDEGAVEPHFGETDDADVPIVETDEMVTFTRTVVRAYKPRF